MYAELTAIDEAASSKAHPVATHISRAIELLADRKKPDYRNSVKESISAVEAASRALCGKEKATLSDAVGFLEKQGKVHPALKKSMSSMYGYTSDAEGIRHALMDDPALGFAEAKFMLVCCCAFVNLLTLKSAKP